MREPKSASSSLIPQSNTPKLRSIELILRQIDTMTQYPPTSTSLQATATSATERSKAFPSPLTALQRSLGFPSRTTKAASVQSSKPDLSPTGSTPWETTQDNTARDERKAAFRDRMILEEEERNEKVRQRRALRASKKSQGTTVAPTSL
jgi:hypothetical protein